MSDDKRSHENLLPLSRDEERRLARLGREAAREARRARRRKLQSRGLIRRFRRATIIALVALLLVSMLLPPFLIPVEGITSSRFFIRNAPDTLFVDFEHHTGLDFAAAHGTRVGAARSGRVLAVENDARYGIFVDVRHLFGWVTRYAHLEEASVREGSIVVRGAKIGSVGSTGRATGPHLHFEIRAAGRPLPPGPFLIFHRLRRLAFGAR